MDQAPDVVVRLADRGVARIDRRDAVDVEIVAIRAGIDGPDRELPDAVLAARELRVLADTGDIARGEADGVGLRSVNAEGDLPVRAHLR